MKGFRFIYMWGVLISITCLAQKEELTWTEMNLTDQILNSAFFLDKQNGWVAGGTTVFRTQDGGKTWEKQYIPEEVEFNSIWFIDQNRGWAVGGWRGEEIGMTSDIFSTEDGGKTWVKRTDIMEKAKKDFNVEELEPFIEVQFVDEKHGWMSGYPSLRTVDGGKTWETINIPNVLFRFVNEKVGYSASGSGVYKTQDGGKTWKYLDLSGDIPPTKKLIEEEHHLHIADIFFVTEKVGYIGCAMYFPKEQGVIAKTEDGGITWEFVGMDAFSQTSMIREVFFLNETEGWIIANEKEPQSRDIIFHTQDGGKTWKQELITDRYVTKIFMVDKEFGVAPTAQGTVFIYSRKKNK